LDYEARALGSFSPQFAQHVRPYLRFPLVNIADQPSCKGFLLFGYDQGVMSGLITSPELNHDIPETKDDATMQGLVTAIYEIGCLGGAIFVLFIGEKIGRRKSIITGACIMVLGVIIQITTFFGHQPLAQFIIGRIVMGFGNGKKKFTSILALIEY
jgi:MFS family permease